MSTLYRRTAKSLFSQRNCVPSSFFNLNRSLSLSSSVNAKVAVVGACGGIGRKLALLLKLNPLVKQLNLYDVIDCKGLGLDISHIDTRTVVKSFETNELQMAMDRADIIVIAAGIPRKPGMTRDDLFAVNAKVVATILDEVKQIQFSPKIAIITNPINSIIPFAYTYLYDHNSSCLGDTLAARLFGITTLDSVRANTFYAEHLGKDPREIIVPVLGGHSENTMVPVFSMSNMPIDDKEVAASLIQKIREAGSKVVEVYAGKGSATASMAYAANRFINALLEAHYGKSSYECSYIRSHVHSELEYFAQIIQLDATGVKDSVPFGNIFEWELQYIEKIVPILKSEQEKGKKFAEEMLVSRQKPASTARR